MQYFSGVYTIQKLVKCQQISQRATVAGRPPLDDLSLVIVRVDSHIFLCLLAKVVLHCSKKLCVVGQCKTVKGTGRIHQSEHDGVLFHRLVLSVFIVQSFLTKNPLRQSMPLQTPASPVVPVGLRTRMEPTHELNLLFRHAPSPKKVPYHKSTTTNLVSNNKPPFRAAIVLFSLSNLSARYNKFV